MKFLWKQGKRIETQGKELNKETLALYKETEEMLNTVQAWIQYATDNKSVSDEEIIRGINQRSRLVLSLRRLEVLLNQ